MKIKENKLIIINIIIILALLLSNNFINVTGWALTILLLNYPFYLKKNLVLKHWILFTLSVVLISLSWYDLIINIGNTTLGIVVKCGIIITYIVAVKFLHELYFKLFAKGETYE